jgi:hypothetical protein
VTFIVQSATATRGITPRLRGAWASKQLSSERVRITPARTGNPRGRRWRVLHPWITSASAGSIAIWARRSRPPTDHPCACREHNAAFHEYTIVFGAPPHGGEHCSSVIGKL